MDRIRLIPDRAFLTNEVTDAKHTHPKFIRRYISKGRDAPTSLTLQPDFGPCTQINLTIVAQRLDDGRWRVTCIDAVLPQLLHGHNGRPIRSNAGLALALTVLRFIVSLVVWEDCRCRIIPGVGPENLGYIRYLEAMIQFQDPDRQLLLASHVARYHYQHKPPHVCWGQSTKVKRKELDMSFYDKSAQLGREGNLDPSGCPGTRYEFVLKNGERLARELGKAGVRGGEVVSTLTIPDAYTLIRHSFGFMSGHLLPDREAFSDLHKTARTLIAGLGDNIMDPHAVDQAIETYRRVEDPNPRTFRRINKEVRAYSFSTALPNFASLIPESIDDLPWSDVTLQIKEMSFAREMKEWGAPTEADPDILAAWSTTTFLKKKPVDGELVGALSVPTKYLPFKRFTL